jgi:DNA polymerase III epsilon subunit-like protein
MILFIDTETNNLPNKYADNNIEKWPRIVQIAWSVYDDNERFKSSQNFIVYPLDFVISDETAKVHGITNDIAKEKGVLLNKVLLRLNDDMPKIDTIIAHNLDFDIPVIKTEYERCRIKNNISEKQTFCTMKSNNIINYCAIPSMYCDGYKWPSLSELHIKLFGVDFTGGHDASDDIEACAKCYFELKSLGIIGDVNNEW